LKITEKYTLNKNKTTEPGTLEENMLTALEQAITLNSMVLDPE